MAPKHYKRYLAILILVLALIVLGLIAKSFAVSAQTGMLAMIILVIVLLGYYFMSRPRQ